MKRKIKEENVLIFLMYLPAATVVLLYFCSVIVTCDLVWELDTAQRA